LSSSYYYYGSIDIERRRKEERINNGEINKLIGGKVVGPHEPSYHLTW
jgi:hypothetical protein